MKLAVRFIAILSFRCGSFPACNSHCEVQSTVNVDPPVASVTAAPATPLPSRTASFSFSGSEGTDSFQCQLYGSAVADGNYTACTSPR